MFHNLAMDTQPLLPCPFCGGSETEFREQKMWTGVKFRVYAVYVTHHCPATQYPRTRIEVRGKTHEEAAETWNRRAG